jgi:hypothetical protein
MRTPGERRVTLSPFAFRLASPHLPRYFRLLPFIFLFLVFFLLLLLLLLVFFLVLRVAHP